MRQHRVASLAAIALLLGLVLILSPRLPVGAQAATGPQAATGAQAVTGAQALTGPTTRVSLSSATIQGDQWSGLPAISGSGRFVAFASRATTLVTGDTNAHIDVFLHDRLNATTIRVSVSPDGTDGNGNSEDPALSADGNFIAFASAASNLVEGDTNGDLDLNKGGDVFVYNRSTGKTSRVSVSSAGDQGDAASTGPAISADGNIVAFSSVADNLVDGDDNGVSDVFVHDRRTRTTTRVSINSDGEEGDADSSEPALSADGNIVAFKSEAGNLVGGDNNGLADIFVHDRRTGTTTRVSIGTTTAESDDESYYPAISADGNLVTFASYAANLVSEDTNADSDIFVHDRQAGTTVRVSVSSSGAQGVGGSFDPAISADGSTVAFWSTADNLVIGDTNEAADAFIRDLRTGETIRVSVNSAGQQGNGASQLPILSADGRVVAFQSGADNLVSGDTNGVQDVFVHEQQRGPAPTITRFTPTKALVGKPVTISGKNLQATTSVTFGGISAGIKSKSATKVVVTVPTDATTGTIVVNTPGGAAASTTDFIVIPPRPTITGFSPAGGPAGMSVIITGTKLSGTTDVKFGTKTASFTVNAAGTQITATVPTGAKTGVITVTTPGGTAKSRQKFVVR